MTKCFSTALGLCLLLTPGIGAETPYEQDCQRLAGHSGDDAARLHELFKINWEYTMRENPELATEVGYPGQNDRWSDMSLEAIARGKREAGAPLPVLASIDRAKLSDADKLNFDLFKRMTGEAVEGARFKGELMPVNQMGGVQQQAAQTLEIAPRATVADYEASLKRLERLPTLIDQTIVLLQQGLSNRITPPRVTLRDVSHQIRNQMVKDPKQNPLLRPFREFPPEIAASDRERLQGAAIKLVREQVIPSFGRLEVYFTKTYLPATRESIACADLPDGLAWYAYRARVSTTTTLSPKQIHELGLREVERIRGEMDRVIQQTGFKGGFDKFCKDLRTNPKFYYQDPESLLRGYRDISKRVDPELARLFGKLPRVPYGVRAIPTFAEKSQTTAYYQPGSVMAGRPGYFYANTYDLKMRPKWEMEALTLHEAVPGHHLQISLAQEMTDVPEFRKQGGYTAFVEGWGLYSESLGSEMGFYQDPYSKFGQLTYEMWRAVRLVVDTGMHTMSWSRQQAIDYFIANSSKTEHDIVVEIDRYIVWPGQALAYKIGELKIKELRAYATKELGAKFDVRAFHDHVLENGAVPLDVLEAHVKDWVRKEKTSKSKLQNSEKPQTSTSNLQ